MKTKKFHLVSERLVYKCERFVVDVPEFITHDPKQKTLEFFMSDLLKDLVKNPEAHAQLIETKSFREVEDDDWGMFDELKSPQVSWEEVTA